MISANFKASNRISLIFLLVFTVLSLSLLSLSDTTSLQKPQEFGLSFVSFFQTGIYESGQFLKASFQSISELRRMGELYEESLEEIESYQGIERELIQLRQENQFMRDILDLQQNSTFESIAVELIARDPENLFSTLIINKGSRKGIREGMPVLAYQDGMLALVGRVYEVGINSAMVLPISDQSSYVAARMQNSRYEGLIRGMGGLSNNLRMEYLSESALPDINREDIVITSGLNSLYPKDIIIGRVVAIEIKEYSSSLELEIQPIVDFDRLEYLLVLRENP